VRTRIGEYQVAHALNMEQIDALRSPRPEGEAERPPRRQRPPRPERRAGLEYFNANQPDAEPNHTASNTTE
jgi:tRNA pseudouridine55 synthase